MILLNDVLVFLARCLTALGIRVAMALSLYTVVI